MRKKILEVLLAMLTLSLPQSASALCTLVCSCSVSTTSVTFGAYNPISPSPFDSTGNVRVTCGGVLGLLIPYDIALDKGTLITPRKMISGSNTLNYDLYTSSAHTVIWGDGTGGTQIVSDDITITLLGGTSKNHTVYGRIPGSQIQALPGNYSDTVTVTVTYY